MKEPTAQERMMRDIIKGITENQANLAGTDLFAAEGLDRVAIKKIALEAAKRVFEEILGSAELNSTLKSKTIKALQRSYEEGLLVGHLHAVTNPLLK